MRWKYLFIIAIVLDAIFLVRYDTLETTVRQEWSKTFYEKDESQHKQIDSIRQLISVSVEADKKISDTLIVVKIKYEKRISDVVKLPNDKQLELFTEFTSSGE